MADRKVDRDKLRVALHRLSKQQVFYMLEEAIGMLSDAELVKLTKPFMNTAALRPDRRAKGRLLAEVRAFEKVSLAGKYYEAFFVNSKNYMEMSTGTETWIAECGRLFDRCVAEAGRDDPAEMCQAFETLASLLDRLDENPDEVIFFADEGGSWQAGIDWEKVLPAWFACLAATAEPQEYVQRVRDVIAEHLDYDRAKYLAKAKKVTTPEQRKAFREKS